jgi:electron transfer flavoprotein alpha subunit
MGYIKINQDKIDQEIAEKLKKLCPFNAFDYVDAYLSINASCRVCKICVNKGPEGTCEFIESNIVKIDKSLYKGIAVYIEHHMNQIHPVSFELIGKAIELKQKTKEDVYAIIIGDKTKEMITEVLKYGVDYVVSYEDSHYQSFDIKLYTDVMESFFKEYHHNIFLIGGTPQGRSFAPRVAARLKTGLTADCTKLELEETGDLLQIRPAFGGNIMAKINTPNHRPQMATIRYKMFSAPPKVQPLGIVINKDTSQFTKDKDIEIIETILQPKASDISDAEIIIAVGRAFKKQKDLELIEPLRKKLNAELACTRPLIENGWFDPRKQIGLSGRTVKPKLIINLGISGAVQYIEGMKDSELIISVNTDPNSRLFDISHYSIIGDIYDVLPELNLLIDQIMEVKE